MAFIHRNSESLFPSCIANIIAEYAKEKQLSKWIDMEMNWEFLSSNPAAMDLLKNNINKICWWQLSNNPAAINLLESNLDKIIWLELSENPAAIFLLENNPHEIDWYMLSANPAAMSLLNSNDNKIDWWGLSKNTAAVSLLKTEHDETASRILLSNHAFYTYEDCSEEKNFHSISKNISTVPILETNIDKVIWCQLSKNPSMIHILRDNIFDKYIFYNSAAFQSSKYDIYRRLIR